MINSPLIQVDISLVVGVLVATNEPLVGEIVGVKVTVISGEVVLMLMMEETVLVTVMVVVVVILTR